MVRFCRHRANSTITVMGGVAQFHTRPDRKQHGRDDLPLLQRKHASGPNVGFSQLLQQLRPEQQRVRESENAAT